MNNHVRNYDIFNGKDLEIADLIQRRRLQILIHSCLYYHMNTNIVTDKQYDTWARELQKLQSENPKIARKVIWNKAFDGFDASTGFDLPITDPWVMNKAKKLIDIWR